MDTIEYNLMKQYQDIETAKQRQDATDRANKAYNKGLWNSLPLLRKYMYPLLMHRLIT